MAMNAPWNPTEPTPPTGPAPTTNGNDYRSYYNYTNSLLDVDMLGGNDTARLYGTGDYDVNLGSGYDRVYNYTTGTSDVFGGAGNDAFYHYSSGTLNADGGTGRDSFYANSTGILNATGGADNDYFLIKNFNAHSINGGSGHDIASFRDLTAPENGSGKGLRIDLNGAGVVENLGDPGSADMQISRIEQIYTTKMDDTVIGSSVGEVISGGDGKDVIRGNGGDDSIYGGNGNDILSGGEGDDYISGGNGADSITAGAGRDIVYGGAGNDWIRVEEHGGEADSSNDYFDGGINETGTMVDTISYSGASGGIYVDAEYGQVTGVGAGVPVVSTNGPFTMTQMFIDTVVNFEGFQGTNFDDTFRGSSDAGVEEHFSGLYGTNLYIASAGADNFTGVWDFDPDFDDGPAYEQHDTVDYSRMNASSVTLDLSARTGTVYDSESSAQWTHTYKNIDAVIGTKGADVMTGDNHGQSFEGGKGNDTFFGKGGADTFVFDGTEGYLGYDKVRDFERGEDVLEFTGMHLNSGQAINGFGVLDSNDDGKLTDADADVVVFSDNTYLVAEEGLVRVDGVSEMTATDFMFG